MIVRNEDWVMFDLINPQNLLRAILAVWSRYTTEGQEPGSERWIYDDEEWGPRLFQDIRLEWRKHCNAKQSLKYDPSCFPYSMSFIRRAWVNVRKFNDSKKREMCEAFGVPIPKEINCEKSDSSDASLF